MRGLTHRCEHGNVRRRSGGCTTEVHDGQADPLRDRVARRLVADEDGRFDWGEPDEEVHTFINELERSVGTYL
jgi:hypothetical protein